MTNPSLAELENDVLRDRYARAKRLLSQLLTAAEQYVEPKPGQPFLTRSGFLLIKNRIKKEITQR